MVQVGREGGMEGGREGGKVRKEGGKEGGRCELFTSRDSFSLFFLNLQYQW